MFWLAMASSGFLMEEACMIRSCKKAAELTSWIPYLVLKIM